MRLDQKERAQEMIKEYREIERYIEEQIGQLKTRLDETRMQRGIIQEYLETKLEDAKWGRE